MNRNLIVRNETRRLGVACTALMLLAGTALSPVIAQNVRGGGIP